MEKYRIEYNNQKVIQVIENTNSVTATANNVIVSSIPEAKLLFKYLGITTDVLDTFTGNTATEKPIWHSFHVELNETDKIKVEVTEIGKITAVGSPITFNVRYFVNDNEDESKYRENIVLIADNKIKFQHPVTNEIIGDFDLMTWLNENGYSLKEVIETGLRGRVSFILETCGYN